MKELVFDGKQYNVIDSDKVIEIKRAVNSIEDEVVNIHVAMRALKQLTTVNEYGVTDEIRAAIRECLCMIDTIRDIMN